MNSINRTFGRALFSIIWLGLPWLATGCAKTPPPVVEAEGIVLLDGVPLPHARVEFVPELKQFGAEMCSTATTDDNGKFQLVCNRKSQLGAVVASHRVIVAEVAHPIDPRGRDNWDAEMQRKQAELEARLTNRPIPPEYASVGTTPLRVEVMKGLKTYELKLTRTP